MFEQFSAIKMTCDGGYVLAGGTSSNNGDVTENHGSQDFWIVKINYSGAIEWQRCYGGSGYDEAYDIQQTADSGYIAVGRTYSVDGDVTGNHGGCDIWAIKISSTGALQWQKCLGGSDYEEANSVCQTRSGDYIIAGITKSVDGDVTESHGASDSWIIKLTSTGNIEWAKTYGGSSYEEKTTVVQTFDGGYIFGTSTTSSNGEVTGHHGSGTNADLWVVKLDDTGWIEWQRSLGGSHDEYECFVVQCKDSGYMVSGVTNSPDGDVTGYYGVSDTGGQDGWFVKLTQSGSIEWNKCVYPCLSQNVNSVMQATDGGYIFAGTTCPGHVGNGSAWVGKLSDTGRIDWTESYGGSQIDEFYAVAPTNDGSCMVVGYAYSQDGDVSGNHGRDDAWVVKLGWHAEVKEFETSISFTFEPNPAHQFLNISTEQAISNVVVTNLIGQQMIVKNCWGTKLQVDVSSLPTGVYFLKVNNMETVKFLKE